MIVVTYPITHNECIECTVCNVDMNITQQSVYGPKLYILIFSAFEITVTERYKM